MANDSTGYITYKGDYLVRKVTYDIGPLWVDEQALKMGWYRNTGFAPQPIAATFDSTLAVQIGGGQSTQYSSGGFAYDTSGASAVTFAVPDEMQSSPVAPRTLEHGLSYMTFYGPAAAGKVFTRTFNTLDVGTGHPFKIGQLVTVGTTNTLPSGLQANELLYISARTSTAVEVSRTPGGSSLNLSTDGTGVHTLYPYQVRGAYPANRNPDFSPELPLMI